MLVLHPSVLVRAWPHQEGQGSSGYPLGVVQRLSEHSQGRFLGFGFL